MSMAHGFGIYTNTDGSMYMGAWKFDTQHGKGVEKWSNGSKFEGEYFEGNKEGFGEFYFADTNATYRGEWQNNVMQGFGTYNWKDKRQYTGYWLRNMKDGMGS